ncbi:hypothetical protein RKD49_006665 [Streptomyces glaucescens]|jgi:hypothetical protein|uniref:hypothetical protein n=1 Tax=unclassified Streptomyces TaxID=2593676 RepID=UPI00093AB5B2|nr:hypothetical protein [Streptomyces sp. TSRI0107]OKJ81398.1 hypothetical protein AMK31_23655 [Streptomyces sp. TSRI0107]
MFQLIRTISGMDLAARQAPVFAVSFVIAALFYKFGNFALEAVAFLATWFVLDALVEGVRSALRHFWKVRPQHGG